MPSRLPLANLWCTDLVTLPVHRLFIRKPVSSTVQSNESVMFGLQA
jgi:hypothetical protein